MDVTRQNFKYQNFPTHFRLLLFTECFGEIWQKSVKSTYPINKSGCIPPKIWCKILAHKGSQTTHATPGDYLVSSWNLKPIGERDLLASTTMDQDFPRKVTHCWHLFLYLDRSKSVEEDDTIMSKVAKGKGKPRQKWKNREPGWGARQRIDIQLSKLRFEAIVNVFVSRLVLA